jgi:hypothetical protein
LRACASDLMVKFSVEHDGAARKDQSGEDRSAAPAFRATAVCVLAMNPYPEKAELWTRESTCVIRLHGRTEGFSPSGVRASACRTTAAQRCGCRRRAGTRRAHVEPRNDTTARQRSAHGDDGSGTCKRPARLHGRLSSDGGSARRRGAGQRATYKQQAHKARSSLGSKAGSTTRSRGLRLTLCSWTRRRGGGVEVRRRSGRRAEDAEPGSARFGLRQANNTVKRKKGGSAR